MASFIVRTMAHTNTRPANVSAQSDGAGGVRVSVRSRDFQPVPNAVIDAFWIVASRADELLNDDGTCSRLGQSVSGEEKCKIDDADESTDLSGNLVPSGTVDSTKGAVVWVWTGESGSVGASTDLFRLDIAPAPLTLDPASVKVTTSRDQPVTGQYEAPYGSTVTYTLQLQASLPNGTEVDVGPGKDGASYRLKRTYPNESTTVTTLKFNSGGEATFEATVSDPSKNPGDSGDVVVVLDEADGNLPDLSDGEDGLGAPDVPNITFSDARPGATTIAVQTGGYDLSPRTSATNTVTVIVTDQFGNGVSGVSVRLRAVEDNGDNPDPTADDQATVTFRPQSSVTVSSGMAQIQYRYRGDAGAQTFEAYVPVVVSSAHAKILAAENTDIGDRREVEHGDALAACPDGDDDGNDPDCSYPAYGSEPLQSADDSAAGATTFYWASEGGLVEATAADVIAADLDSNEIVVGPTTGPRLLVFDSNDQFRIDQTGVASKFGLEEFVKALASDNDVDPTKTADVSITWGNYDPDDSAVVTGWALTIG